MRIRQFLAGSAIAAAIAKFRISTEVVEAPPMTECARLASEVVYWSDLGRTYIQAGNTWSVAGDAAAAQDAYASAETAFTWSASYEWLWRRTCQTP